MVYDLVVVVVLYIYKITFEIKSQNDTTLCPYPFEKDLYFIKSETYSTNKKRLGNFYILGN